MSTRYILYVESKAQAEPLLKGTRLKPHCTVQLLSKLESIPAWFRELEAPMLADTVAQQIYFGEESVTKFCKAHKTMYAEPDALED